ncbi:hypothetical protein SADUNF_Sadunf10G0000700 [Salix dunnii]|uniref:Two-component response regulator n=1 Tax=Salix dunnii TaxID=1413687 RepID=A0A835JPI5_9ROSI|nr:hypothetical protein SADUNF_Sadunf10G0000700 [Salix dunnii]
MLNLGYRKGSMSTASSGGVSDQFPAGLRVLVVDDDPTCLVILEKMLRTCLYEDLFEFVMSDAFLLVTDWCKLPLRSVVTKCNRAEIALSLLREKRNGYDIVISDVHMPDMDGFKLLEHIGLEMDLPVIMMSADDGKNVVMKGVTHGACDYLIKPIRIEALKNIWQHVVRKKKNEQKDLEQSGSVEEGGDRQQKQAEDADYSSSANEGSWKNSKRRKEEEEEVDERDDTSTLKKPRVVWSVELHQQFVAAVNQLGIDKAVPKKILELMNVPGLTRENVASHLQKYRLYLRRLSGVSQHQSGMGNSFISTQEATYGSLSSLNGLDLQTLAAASQIPAQSLATLQAAGLGRSTAKPRLPMPIVDQRNLFSFENPKLRFGEGQQQNLNNGKQMNLLHGIPTTMEPKQLANMHHSAQSLGSMNMQLNAHGDQSGSLLMQMSQQQSRGQILNETTGSQVPRLPSSIGQPIVNNALASGVLARNGLAENGRGTGFNPVSQSSSTMNFPLNTTADLATTSFALGSAPGVPSITSKGMFPEEINSEIKGPGGFIMPSYDIFSDLQHHRSHDWELQNAGMTFNGSQQSNSLQSNVDVASSVLAHQGFSSSQSNGQGTNISAVGKPMFSAGDATDHVSAQSLGQPLNTLFAENFVRVKTERVPDSSLQTTLFNEQFGQEDLMSALLKQVGFSLYINFKCWVLESCL